MRWPRNSRARSPEIATLVDFWTSVTFTVEFMLVVPGFRKEPPLTKFWTPWPSTFELKLTPQLGSPHTLIMGRSPAFVSKVTR